MSKKFKNKYRIESTRLKNWDYGWNAAYFITICTKNRECYFGYIINGKMQLSEIGKIAHKYWLQIPEHFPSVILDEFVVMPNHVHGVLIINNEVKTPQLGVSTDRDTIDTNASKKWKPATLGVIINQYKRICTIKARKIIPNFAWQSRFHDHIIRNDDSFHRIKKYIYENPVKWDVDKF